MFVVLEGADESDLFAVFDTSCWAKYWAWKRTVVLHHALVLNILMELCCMAGCLMVFIKLATIALAASTLMIVTTNSALSDLGSY